MINKDRLEEVKKEEIWKEVVPGKEYDDTRFRKYTSDLSKLVESFLAQQCFDDDKIGKSIYLMESIDKKKIDKLYNSSIRVAKKLSESYPHRSSEHYYHKYEIEKNYYKLTDYDIKRSKVSNVEEIAANLDKFYISEKLKYYCSVLSSQSTVAHKYEIRFIDEIIEHLQENDYEDTPPIAIYLQIYLALKDFDNEEHYFKLKSLLEHYGLLFPLNEASNIYKYALNYCTRKINRGNQKFLHEYFDLYVETLNKEIIFDKGEISPWHFKNIVTTALRLGKFEWTEKFIFKYKDRIPEELRNNAITFNLAQLYFYQKKYNKVIEQLQFVEYDDLSYNINSKTMLIATYYELDEIEPLYSLLESFRVYLNRHKDIAEQIRNLCLNLIKFTKKLVKVLPGDQESIQKLKNEVEATKNIASIRWLREKIAELEGNY
ncbi:hypothetical protein [Flavilitoribacter nigricans]|nr:hypothetical protein [Flavilitoribacter nigricans]